MSAFLCSNQHTTIVTRLIFDMGKADGLTYEEVFAELRIQNIYSMAYRYPNEPSIYKNSVIGFDDGLHLNGYADAVKLTHSYRYQSCEHPWWAQSKAQLWTSDTLTEIGKLWDTDDTLAYAEERYPNARWSIDE